MFGASEREFGTPGTQFPVLMIVMLASFVGVFMMELRYPSAPPPAPFTPSIFTLTDMGGLSFNLVKAGQWYRLFSAPFLHGGKAHLIGNCVAFGLACFALERTIGRAWTFLVFALGGLAGSIASIMVSPPNVISVGASGAIMAMLVCLFLVSFRFPAGKYKRFIQFQSLRTVVPALMPMGSAGVTAVQIDYGAHAGGAMLGLVAGFLLLALWRDSSQLPRFHGAALGFSVVAFLGVAGSAYAVSHQVQQAAMVPTDLVPVAQLPRGAEAIVAEGERLAKTYPHDPIARLFSARSRLVRGDQAGAETELRAGLTIAANDPARARPAVVNNLRGTLALLLIGQGREVAARDAARHPCSAKGVASPEAEILAGLAQAGLCPVAAVKPSVAAVRPISG